VIFLSLDLINAFSSMLEKKAVDEIVKCNEFTVNYGLILSKQDAIELVETRTNALKDNRRIEFGRGVIDKIIKEFCDSPYISQSNYAETLHALIEMFYYYKNETLDKLSDDELIKFMKNAFDGRCFGSLELLECRELENLARNIRYGNPYDLSGEFDEEDEDDVY